MLMEWFGHQGNVCALVGELAMELLILESDELCQGYWCKDIMLVHNFSYHRSHLHIK
jgi:hypothetical protein